MPVNINLKGYARNTSLHNNGKKLTSYNCIKLEEWYIAFYTTECPESPQWGILVSDFDALPFFSG